MMEKAFAEPTRRATALALLWFGWISTIVLVTLRTFGVLSQQWGSLVVFTVAVAVAASITRSRMRLRDTIIETFQVGLDAGEERATCPEHARHPSED